MHTHLGTLTIEWNGHTIVIGPTAGGGDVFVTLNGDQPHRVADPAHLHLNFSDMACCIGDSCLMWPAKQGVGAAASSSSSFQPVASSGAGMPTFKVDFGGGGGGSSSGFDFGAGLGFPSSFPTSAPAEGTTTVAVSGGEAGSPWKFEAIGVTDEATSPLSVDGKGTISSAQLVADANAGCAVAGKPLAFSWNGHLVEVGASQQ